MTYRLSYTELAEGRACIALDVDARTCLADQEAARESLLGLVEKVIGRPPDDAVDPIAQGLRDGTLACSFGARLADTVQEEAPAGHRPTVVLEGDDDGGTLTVPKELRGS